MNEEHGIFSVKEILGELRSEVRVVHDTLIMHMGREESQLENILLENKKTNGRVNSLEEDYHLLSVKHEAIGVKLAVITAFTSIIVAAVVSAIINKLVG